MILRALASLCAALAVTTAAAQDEVRPTMAVAPDKREAATAAPKARRAETTHRSLIGRGMSVDDARNEAIARAQAKAVEQVIGTSINQVIQRTKQETRGDVSDSYVQAVTANVAGRVTDFQILSEGIETRPGLEGEAPQNYYAVKISAEVTPDAGRPDPGFQLDVKLNAEIYHDRGNPYLNDDVVTTVQASQDAFITIFYIEDNVVTQAFPNQYMNDTRVRAGRPALFPSEELRNGLGLRFRVDTLKNGKREQHHMIVVVATKTKVPFDAGELRSSAKPGEVPVITSNALALNRWLSRIPLDQRTVGHAIVEVRFKDRP